LPERRGARRVTAPLPELHTQSVTWQRRPVELLDVSATGAKISIDPHPPPHAGELLVVEVRAFGLVAHLAGKVRWVRAGECGIAFDETLMTASARRLLDRVLGQ
jgi:hypothetical protein